MNYNNYCSWKEKNIINSSSELHITQIWWFPKGNIEYSLKLINFTVCPKSNPRITKIASRRQASGHNQDQETTY